jgi:hypothetical protein
MEIANLVIAAVYVLAQLLLVVLTLRDPLVSGRPLFAAMLGGAWLVSGIVTLWRGQMDGVLLETAAGIGVLSIAISLVTLGRPALVMMDAFDEHEISAPLRRRGRWAQYMTLGFIAVLVVVHVVRGDI